MSGYLQNYGVGEERRNRIIKWLIISGVSVVSDRRGSRYLFLHNYFETQTVKTFLAEVNSRQYDAAYHDWGCSELPRRVRTTTTKDFWKTGGPEKKTTSPWKVESVEGCTSFVTVNVQAQGSELQSLGVLRGAKTVMYAPSPECQEKTWRWKQFFHRLFGGGS